MNLYSWLKDHAKARPDKAALRYRDTEVSYAELFSLTGRLGTALRNAGIGRGDHVTIVLPNIPEFVITYMATVGIGAVAVPVNPSFTSRELAHVLTDSDSKAVVMEAGRISTYTEIRDQHPLDIVITTGEGELLPVDERPDKGIIEDMDLDDTAAMIYSSGLTGIPWAPCSPEKLDHNSA